jgi:formylglycine-generating enzyme required for sulfatase activity
VKSYPGGASALGIFDLAANVWQHTDAYCDDRSCAVVLRGGSLYAPVDAGRPPPARSRYFPQAQANNAHVRLLYADASQTRSAYVGFRCVVDTPLSAEAYARLGGLPALADVA